MGKKAKVLKTGAPKFKDLKEFEQVIVVEGSNLDQFQNVLTYALPELGRKLARVHYESGKSELVNSINLATSINIALNDQIEVSNYHQQRRVLSKHNGFEDTTWTTTDKCNTTRTSDFQDLYETPKYEIIVRVVVPLKSKEELTKLGVK